MNFKVFSKLLLVATLFNIGCGSNSGSDTVTATGTSTTILLERSSNTTSVTLNNLVQGSAQIVSGSYSFECDVNYTTSVDSFGQTSDTSSGLGVLNIQTVAQSFIATETGKLTSIAVNLQSNAQQDVTLYLYSSLPTNSQTIGTPLVSQVLTVPAGGASQWLTATLATPIDVVQNSTYYIMIRNSTSNFVNWRSSAPTSRPYADGTTYLTNSGLSYNFVVYPQSELSFSVDIEYKHSPVYQYFYNGVASAAYSTYPAGQAITIDGGAAGYLKFTPLSTAPTDNVIDPISILLE